MIHNDATLANLGQHTATGSDNDGMRRIEQCCNGSCEGIYRR
jgi:hypothetical protein